MEGEVTEMGVPRALTIAGSDCSGGAGIQADLKTFHAFGVYGMSAITAVVAENTVGVQGWREVEPALVAEQVSSCLSDIGADAAKTGMLVNAAVVEAVAAVLRKYRVARLVVDPVMRAKSGDPLIAPEAVSALVEKVFPLAEVVTPNVPEAEALVGFPLRTDGDFRRAAKAIRALGPRVVVLKGGHSPLNPPGLSRDFVWDGREWEVLEGPRSPDRNTHGTGCTFSAAVAAGLAQGLELGLALRRAKAYVGEAIRTAPGLGGGHGPVNHWAKTEP
jgi:hydroxymethylpyrimidine/phosphomethylpyrimidine kinase